MRRKKRTKTRQSKKSYETCLFVLIACLLVLSWCTISGADPGFFLGGGAPVSCSTSTPINHIVLFYCRIPVVLEKRKSSHGGKGGGAHPLHPPPRSAPAYYDEPIDGKFTNGERELRERKKKGPIGSTETGSIRYGEKISPGSRRVPLLAESTLVCVYMRLKN